MNSNLNKRKPKWHYITKLIVFFLVFKQFYDVHLKGDLSFRRGDIYISKMAAYFPSSCNALIWHCATTLLAAWHVVPLTLHFHSNPVWELLLHELLDINGDWRTQVAFWYAFLDRSSLFLFITRFSLSFSLLSFNTVNLPFSFPPSFLLFQ